MTSHNSYIDESHIDRVRWSDPIFRHPDIFTE